MKDSNKLIAEFMGLVVSDRENYTSELHTNVDADLKYHTEWNWIKPVIKKINEVTGYDDYNTNRLHLQRVLDDCINENAVGIKEVCKAIVEFIKQHNKQA